MDACQFAGVYPSTIKREMVRLPYMKKIAHTRLFLEHGLFPYSEGKMLYGSILGKQLKVQGFIVTTFNDKKKEANEQLAEWLKEARRNQSQNHF